MKHSLFSSTPKWVHKATKKRFLNAKTIQCLITSQGRQFSNLLIYALKLKPSSKRSESYRHKGFHKELSKAKGIQITQDSELDFYSPVPTACASFYHFMTILDCHQLYSYTLKRVEQKKAILSRKICEGISQFWKLGSLAYQPFKIKANPSLIQIDI